MVTPKGRRKADFLFLGGGEKPSGSHFLFSSLFPLLSRSVVVVVVQAVDLGLIRHEGLLSAGEPQQNE